MAISNSDLIRDAHGLIGVLGAVESLTNEQANLGLRVLNELLTSWLADGIDLQYFEQTDPGVDTPIPPSAVACVKYFLAFALAPYYGKQVQPAMAAEGSRLYGVLVRNTVIEQTHPISVSLPAGEGQWWGATTNILDG